MDTKTCNRCSGSGKVFFRLENDGKETFIKCSVCYGTGKVVIKR
jgi:hypothetical protein